MKKPQFTEEQLIKVLREVEDGANIEEICRKHGISDTAYRKSREQQEEQMPAEERRLKQLEDENRRLKSLVADLTLRNEALRLVVSKKW